ncbi:MULTISPECIES: hemolysin family protein [unclassified Aminobacter]|uniref:hemolysin family protein n=1 Tax=unclassified Aminobacter TaxID=2644704 RepID=UPI000463C31E|nr:MULTISPECIES: hemolysin family protein [unclassified Aminobacter]TWG66030.1 Hemolysins and related proteins containing CBS domains [Aminobacter sp. J44]TWH27249.1 Hemolysins and related proteins containing CBS domains [Aminobacter sp. J15]
MNENAQKAAPAEQGNGGQQGAEQSGEAHSTSAGRTGAIPSIIDRLFGRFRHRNGSNLREDLADALSDDATEDTGSTFSPAERAMLNNILRLRELRVEDVMVPRADIEAIDLSTKLGDLLMLFEESGRSRMPVYHENLDDPRGMVHIRDVVGHVTRLAKQKRRGRKNGHSSGSLDLANVDLSQTVEEANIIRPVLFVPPSMLASDLMARMQAERIQMALVIDEYGGTDGLVSLEDVVEMVVGDIEDEHDDDEPMIVRASEGVFLVDAKAEIEEVAEVIGDAFKAGEHAEDVDTIGGMIFNTLGRVPARGEVVRAIPGFEFHVLDADPRRVKRVRIVQTRVAAERRRAAAKSAAREEQGATDALASQPEAASN